MSYTISDQGGVVVISLNGKIMGGPEATEINEKFKQVVNYINKKNGK